MVRLLIGLLLTLSLASYAQTATNTRYGVVKVGAGISVDASGVISATATQGGVSTIVAGFLVGDEGEQVDITVNDKSWLAIGQDIYIENAGYYSVTAFGAGNTLTVTCQLPSGTLSPGDAAQAGLKVRLAGLHGANGNNGVFYSTLNGPLTMPPVSSTVNATTSYNDWTTVGAFVYVAGAGFFKVTGIPQTTSLVLQNLGYTGNAAPGTVIASGGKIVAAGPQGPQGTAGSGGTSTPVYSTTVTTRADLQRAIDAVTSNARITLMPGVYPLNGTNLTLGSKSNVTIDGLRSATIVAGASDMVLVNGNTSNLTIEGLTFSCTATTGATGANGSGLLSFNEQGSHTDLTIRNNTFTAPSCLRNGISTNTYSATADGGSGTASTVNRLKIQNNRFISLGRMGVEVLNHSWSDGRTDVLVNDVDVSNNEFYDTGRVAEADGTTYNGMAYSNSGRATNVRFVGNNVKDAKTYGIEFVGVNNGLINDNTVNYVSNSFVGISIADGYGNGATATQNITIANNGVRTKSRPINMRGTTNANLTGNTLVADLIDNSNLSSVYFQKCTGVTLTGGSVFVNSYNPIRLDDCSDMVIAPGRVTSLQTNNYASISIFAGTGYAGAGSSNIRIGVNGGLYKKSNGVTTTPANIYELQGTVTGVTTY